MLYCWRGGQRSGSFATILRAIGWRVETVEGGYQAYRSLVSKWLYGPQLPHRLFRLDGYTGTAKTELLALIAERGGQVIDLEGHARHRGSALGPQAEPQPAQKGFESELAMALLPLDPERPILIEAESARIGSLRIPPALWTAMKVAPRLTISAPVTARSAYLASAYADVAANPEELCRRLDLLRPLQSHAVVDEWQALARTGQTQKLAGELIKQHYDPAYARLRRRDPAPHAAEFASDSLGADDLARLADQIRAWLTAA